MLVGISTEAYIRNMSALIRALESPAPVETRPATVWQVDSLERIGGHPVTVLGSPRVVATPAGKAVEFDGVDDGLVLDVNAIAGLGSLHGGGRVRARSLTAPKSSASCTSKKRRPGIAPWSSCGCCPDQSWCLDTFLRHGDASLTLIDKAVVHQAGRWHAAALSFDGKTMTHYVDGVRESVRRGRLQAARPGPDVDRRSPEQALVVQGTHPHDPHHSRGPPARVAAERQLLRAEALRPSDCRRRRPAACARPAAEARSFAQARQCRARHPHSAVFA